MDNAVGVDVEGYFNLRNAPGSGGDAVQAEHAQGLVVFGKFTFALEDVDLNGGLAVRGGGEDLGFLGGDGGVALNDLGEHAAQGFQAQGQGGNVQKQQALDLAAQNAALDSRANCNALIRVQVLGRLFAGNPGNRFLNRNNTGGTANQQDLVKLGCA